MRVVERKGEDGWWWKVRTPKSHRAFVHSQLKTEFRKDMKPDLQELYRQKEQARIEKMAEIDEAGKIIRRALDALNQAIVEHKDITTIA